jgi:rubredoxin
MSTPAHRWFWACEGCHLVYAKKEHSPDTCAVCSSERFEQVINVPEAEYTIETIREHERNEDRFE